MNSSPVLVGRRALYGLLMLLPQGDAFALLSRRLAAVPLEALLALDPGEGSVEGSKAGVEPSRSKAPGRHLVDEAALLELFEQRQASAPGLMCQGTLLPHSSQSWMPAHRHCLVPRFCCSAAQGPHVQMADVLRHPLRLAAGGARCRGGQAARQLACRAHYSKRVSRGGCSAP